MGYSGAVIETVLIASTVGSLAVIDNSAILSISIERIVSDTRAMADSRAIICAVVSTTTIESFAVVNRRTAFVINI